ncbi:MAG: glutamate 5-kinase, partial [Kiritimatiellae bacterium]|nr:glutamate 5-kinase [Kiritimatiellia bacterium]
SRVLVRRDGALDLRRMARLAADLAAWRRADPSRSLVLVSSGAIACGLRALRIRRRPTDLPTLQMAAAVGQSRLMAAWSDAFARARLPVAQILLTHDDVRDRARYLNVHATFTKLLEQGVVPVVNENDALANEEIRFGDNDALASRTAMLLDADLLLLLTTVNGFLAATPSGRRRVVPLLPAVTPDALAQTSGKGSPYSTGGMASKLASAAEAAATGTAVVIANGRRDAPLTSVAAGLLVGTLIPPAPRPSIPLNLLRRWVLYFHRPAGTLTIDSGAAKALRSGTRSLLPVGIRAVSGDFAPGDLVLILDPSGTPVARGLARYSSIALRLLAGTRSPRLRELLGPAVPDEAVHLDTLVLSPPP